MFKLAETLTMTSNPNRYAHTQNKKKTRLNIFENNKLGS